MEAVEPQFPTATARLSYEVKLLPPGKRRNVPSLKITTAPQGMLPKNAKLKKNSSLAEVAADRKISGSAGGEGGGGGQNPLLPKSADRIMTRKGSTAGQPSIPWTKRKFCEERKVSIGKKERRAEKRDVALDRAPSDREGRQFAVANVGNNGRIYLRPSIRHAHPKHPQNSFTFPVTPPGTAGVEVAHHDKLPPLPETIKHHEAQYTPTSGTPTTVGGPAPVLESNRRTRGMKHRRAMSDSTIPEAIRGPSISDNRRPGPDLRPSDSQRPKTTNDQCSTNAPTLKISIPCWRLGTPRFTVRGTPMIQGSSFAPTEDSLSSKLSSWNPIRGNPLGSTLPNIGSSRLSHLAVPQSSHSRASQTHSLRLLRPSRSTYLSTHMVIEPAMFTDLTFKPSCDDRTIVRYSSTGTVTAATAPRLVAEITSPSFLDYELISDFFLTFRSFLEPEVLLQMLIARLRWALARMDETGMIVRVRTFVAIRHWILNYFMDDFVLDYGLRVTFCKLLNNFADELAQDAKVRKVQLKILGELKKCWRRICAHYWDGLDFDHALGVSAPIAPGGIFGSRDPSLEPTLEVTEDMAPLPERGFSFAVSDASRFNAELSRIAPLGSHPASGYQLNTTIFRSATISTPQSSNAGAIPKPKTPVGKRVRLARTHLRNNSNTDSLMERKPESVSVNVESEPMPQSAGRLVRGDLLPPGQPFVEVEINDHDGEPNRQTTLVRSQIRNSSKERVIGGTTSGHGVKKLIGSVRRALNSRGPLFSPLQTNYTGLSPVSPLNDQDIVMHPGPGTDVDPPTSSSRRNGARQPMRIDLLGAEVAENFKSAVREGAAAKAERFGIPIPPKTAPIITGPQDYSVAYMDTTFFDNSSDSQKQRDVCDVETNDELTALEIGEMPQGMLSLKSSDQVLADSFLPISGGPTPPTTPPAQGIIGLQSYLLDPPPHEEPPNPTPPFVPDLITPGGADSLRSSEDSSQASSLTPYPRSHDPPPISGGLLRMQKRNEASNTRRPIRLRLRRQASFASRFIRQSMKPNVEPTVGISGLDEYLDDDDDEPPPRYIIRRRPGGDLRAVTNAKDLSIPVLRASRSAGSLTTYSESIRSSYLFRTCPDADTQLRAKTEKALSTESQPALSMEQSTEKLAKDERYLISTQISKAVLPPSFEEAARKLAALPDDDDEDGGIEAALLKLEGKYQPRRKKPSRSEEAHKEEEAAAETQLAAIFAPESESQENPEVQHLPPHERALWLLEGGGRKTPIPAASHDCLDAGSRSVHETRSFFSEASQQSYCSIPLLDRDLAVDNCSTRGKATTWAEKSVFQASDDDGSEDGDGRESTDGTAEAGQSNRQLADKTRSLGSFEVERQSVVVRVQHLSFLDDVSVAGSEISSDLSVDGDVPQSVNGETGLVPTRTTTVRHHTPTPPPHPFGEPLTLSRTTSPAISMSLVQALDMCPERELFQEQLWTTKPLPITPGMPPATSYIDKLASSFYDSSPASGFSPPYGQRQAEAFRKFSVHLPFTLAFDSKILAQQFTLIEQDALSDIDWKDLIEMSWKDSTTSDSRSWVDFLKDSDAYGVEVVIARFNLMVKWAISEIVLTQHTVERAKCIVKFIHIAAHCRSFRNFATLAQLTIALTSNEISRLSRTWELVPEHDLRTLDELETLVTPTRNFYSLRAEMEIGSDGGCIPFVGIYTHDLLYNAQRPSEIASSPNTAPLINFERYRIGAAVVKTLLRLLEASTRYTFQPIEGITERCLWMSALSDDEIRRHSESLE